MGTNNSRLHANGEVLPAKIRPLLRRRIEEIRRRKNGANLNEEEEEATFSKQSLKYNRQHDNNSPAFDENETRDNNPSSNNTQPTKRVEKKLSKVVPLPVSQEQHNKLHNHHHQEKVKSTGPPTENKHEEAKINYSDDSDHDDDDEEEEDEEGEDEIENGRFIGPGSPSFRIYCVESGKRKDQRLHENQSISLLEKSTSANSVESVANPASRNSRNADQVVEIESIPKRKGNKKKKKFRAMKKNLLNVKHLHMNRTKPMAGYSDRRNLLSENLQH